MKKILLIWVLIAVIGRLIPHPPDVTPLMSLSVLAGMNFDKSKALIFTMIALFLSDWVLAFWQGYGVFGNWSLFTYSGFAAVIFFVPRVRGLSGSLIGVLLASLGFWLWTNFGSWLLSGLYMHSWQGLLLCYTAALPFLHNALIGDAVWMLLIYGLLHYIRVLQRSNVSSQGGI